MPKFIELMTTEHNIEIRILSMFIMKSFEICPSAFFLHVHVLVVDLLTCNSIYNEGR